MRNILLIILLFYGKPAPAQKKWHDSSFRIPAIQIDSLEPSHIIGTIYKGTGGQGISYKISLDSNGLFTEAHVRWPFENHYTSGKWAICEKNKLKLDVAGTITYYELFIQGLFCYYVETYLTDKFFKRINKTIPNNLQEFTSLKNLLGSYYHRRIKYN